MSVEKNETPDFLLFENTSFADLVKDIYQTSKIKESQIQSLISQLKDFIKNANDAEVIIPLIKDFLEVSVRNDDQLVKLAAVIQRHLAALTRGKIQDSEGGGEFILSESEKLQLLEIAEQELKQLAQPD